MADVHTSEQRSRNMAAIRSKDTRPEMLIRRGLHGRGYRYSLHHRKLPGHPDLVMKRHQTVVFIHGCFWHGHECPLFRWPASRAEFWRGKILRNREVDRQSVAELNALGWKTITVWECALKGRQKRPLDAILDELEAALGSDQERVEIHGLTPAGSTPRTRSGRGTTAG